MNWRQAAVVFGKELKEVTRDRRTLAFMLLIPTAAIPLFMWLATKAMVHFARKLERREAQVLVLNPEQAPGIVERLERQAGLDELARRLTELLESIRLDAEEISLVKDDPMAFSRLLRERGMEPEQFARRLGEISADLELDPAPDVLLSVLMPPRIKWLRKPPDGIDIEKKATEREKQQKLLAAVQGRKLDAAVEFEPGAASRLAALKSARVKVYYLPSSDRSQAAMRGIRRMLSAVSKSLKTERVRAQGLPAGFERPLLVSYQRLPGPGFMAKLMSMLLPYMILIFSLLGAMYPAIDLGAGEKERGTLETLLSAPVERQALVMGKFGVVLAASVVSALLATASLYVSIKAGALGKFAPEQVSFGPGEAIAAFAVVIPTACIFSSLLMVLSVFARSFKEAQSYASPLQMFIILPAFVSFIPGLELSPATALVPVMNVSLALKAIFTGELGMHVLDIALLLASTVVLAAVLLWFAARWFLREQVLFRS